MPWYKQGTCNVTLNSNAVTGTGTAFIVNARVGDAFRGPDGRWYEVTNVASNTAISIDPPYIGATASAGSYALAPMQGYVKDSADALRAIVNTYGAQLAALKTTGNYDVLPVTKGGTGGTTQADGRTGLGLGSAATATVTTSTTDTTAGRLLKYADFGIGTPIVLPGSADLNTYLTGGLYYCSSPVNGPGGNGWLNVYPLNSTFAVQEFTSINTGLKSFRLLSSGTFGAWNRVISSSNIVGSVTQTSGLPTGAIMEYVTNSNGTAIKFADGTMFCSTTKTYTGVSVTAAAGALFYATSIFPPINYAVPFSSLPDLSMSYAFSGGLGWLSFSGINQGTVSATPSAYPICLSSRANETVVQSIIAKGRWF
ncbi:pyocin knob domain-containing protein [Pseudomonas brassicacearum]|uniref:pyocin knob domain-containing protein n=1 Tax=Pseudomonas brassicacearum TaxID=930166 RepID=UPI001F2F9789|nr:pyocin knob domain-containing protein [Pseudomonas brassicacearum]